METATIGVRIARDLWTRYSTEAQAHGLSLGTYVRRRLEEQDRIDASLNELRAAIVERNAASAPSASATLPPHLEGAMLELLLLLRQIAGPQRAGVAQKEVERRGLPAWK